MQQSLNVKLGLGFSLFLGFIMVNIFWLRISQVQCLVSGSSDPVVCEHFKELKGSSLFFRNLDRSQEFSSLIRNQKGQIFQPLKTERRLPGTLIIHLALENPVYRLQYQDQVFWVNRYHYLGTGGEDFKLPLVVYKAELALNNDRIDPELNQHLVQLVESLEQVQLEFDRLEIDGGQSKIILDNQTPLVFEFGTLPQELAHRAKMMDQQWEQLVTDWGQTPQEVDLRFKLPVARFESSTEAD